MDSLEAILVFEVLRRFHSLLSMSRRNEQEKTPKFGVKSWYQNFVLSLIPSAMTMRRMQWDDDTEPSSKAIG